MSDRHFEREVRQLKIRLDEEAVSLEEMRRNEAVGKRAVHKVVAFSKTGGLCFYCGGSVGKSVHPDHFIPISQGGSDEDDNMFPSCKACNSSKGSFLIEEWRTSRRLKLARENHGMPAISVAAFNWLLGQGFDVLAAAGVPEVKFWFELNGYVTPRGSRVDWKPSASSLAWAEQRIYAARVTWFDLFCHDHSFKPAKVMKALVGLGTDKTIVKQLTERAFGRLQ